jgi:hypothetical protein
MKLSHSVNPDAKLDQMNRHSALPICAKV